MTRSLVTQAPDPPPSEGRLRISASLESLAALYLSLRLVTFLQPIRQSGV